MTRERGHAVAGVPATVHGCLRPLDAMRCSSCALAASDGAPVAEGATEGAVEGAQPDLPEAGMIVDSLSPNMAFGAFSCSAKQRATP